MADKYSIEFNADEIEKLQQIAATLKAAAGQNPEWNELSDWLSGIVNEDDAVEETADKPKRKKKAA